MKRKLVGLTLGTTVVSLAIAATATAGASTASADSILSGGTPQSRYEPATSSAVTVTRAGTSVTLGSVDPNPATGVPCGPPLTIVQAPVSAPTSYTAATAGIMTSFSHNANAAAGQQVRALVMTPFGAPGQYTQVAKTAVHAVTSGSLNTFATRIPVPAGAVLGMQFLNGASACAFNSAADTVYAIAAYNPDTQTNFTGGAFPSLRLNVSAIVESDADGDGFGDVTQDLCPASATTQAACPAPDTKIKKRPAKSSHNRLIRIKFKSTIPGSTFKCSVDGKKFKRCSSPYVKRFGFGKHQVKIQAISPAGIVDPTPAKVKFKITA